MSFELFAHAHGLAIPRLFAADKVQRCPTVDKPRSKNGAWFWDGIKGWVSDWAQGGEIHWYDNPNAKTLSDADRRAWAQRKQAAQQRQENGWVMAARRAESILRDTELKTHDYLMRKGLPDTLGLVDPDGALIVPMRNFATNAVQGVQVVRWLGDEMRWEKKMLPGMRAKGAVLRLGSKTAQELFLCEGYATGLSIEMALRQCRFNAAVLVCFSDSNLVQVASMVQGRAFVVADHDASGAGQKAAEKTSLRTCMSPVMGEDANDLHKRAGLLALCQLVMAVRMT